MLVRAVKFLIIAMFALAPLFFMGCAHRGPKPDSFRWFSQESVSQCIKMQVELYGDLCAESSTGYEQMPGDEAHYHGVACGAQSIWYCLNLP